MTCRHASIVGAAAAAMTCALPLAQAADAYGDALTSYKGELKRDAPDVVNSEFYGTLANSQARRALGNGVDASSANIVEANGAAGSVRSRDPRAPGGVSVASPQVYGNVHGNVIVVVQRGAVRGSITAVQ